jgi:anti-sigma factor RsiW
MNCGEIHELLPLWTTGELEASRRLAVGAHLHDCPDCAAELRQREAEDALLREAMAVESARDLMTARDLERRVMRRIADERSRRWLWPSVAAAAATLAAVLLLTQHHPVQANPAVFSDAARDHTVEIVQKAARHWRTAPAELAALEDSQGISDADVKAVEATGYRLERAKICRLAGLPYMHLVYAKDGREFSVYMRATGGKPVPEADSTSGNLQLASFARGRVQAVIVTDAPRGDCLQFTRDAEAAL